jgi:hypothetical protein
VRAKPSSYALFVAVVLCAAVAGCGNWGVVEGPAPTEDGGGVDEPIEAPEAVAAGAAGGGSTPSQPTAGVATAQEPQTPGVNSDEWAKPLDPPPEAKGLRRLHPNYDVWIDGKGKRIVLAARVVLREGPQLEMFACLFRTKEHESIVSVKAKAQDIHALLMALGATPGHPVQYRPEYRPAEGPEIDIRVHWTDENGRRRSARAQEWVRDAVSGKELKYPFVFAGSGFGRDDEGKERYYGEDGDLICVANFASAVMDLPIKSTDSDAALLFEPFTERIPPVGTVVALILTPDGPIEAPDPRAEEGK